jgi:hypothetical protein
VANGSGRERADKLVVDIEGGLHDSTIQKSVFLGKGEIAGARACLGRGWQALQVFDYCNRPPYGQAPPRRTLESVDQHGQSANAAYPMSQNNIR